MNNKIIKKIKIYAIACSIAMSGIACQRKSNPLSIETKITNTLIPTKGPIEDKTTVTPTSVILPAVTEEPTIIPVPTVIEPTVVPSSTPIPTIEPTVIPTSTPVPSNTPAPTLEPTVTPTSTPIPTIEPTVTPTLKPTNKPTPKPKKELFASLIFIDCLNENTPYLLDVLKNNNMKGTFFILGEQVMQNKDLIKQIKQEGHEIGIQGYDNSNLFNKSSSELQQDFEKTEKLLNEIGIYDIDLVSPNQKSDKIIKSIKDIGKNNNQDEKLYSIIWYTLDIDIGLGSVDLACCRRKNGTIVLVSNLTKENIDRINHFNDDEYLLKYFTFGTITEMFDNIGLEKEDGKLYKEITR